MKSIILNVLMFALFLAIYLAGEACQWLVEDRMIEWHWTFGYISNAGAILILSQITMWFGQPTVTAAALLVINEIGQAFNKDSTKLLHAVSDLKATAQVKHYFDPGDIATIVLFWLIFYLVFEKWLGVKFGAFLYSKWFQ